MYASSNLVSNGKITNDKILVNWHVLEQFFASFQLGPPVNLFQAPPLHEITPKNFWKP
jgi:hypothetical protein